MIMMRIRIRKCELDTLSLAIASRVPRSAAIMDQDPPRSVKQVRKIYPPRQPVPRQRGRKKAAYEMCSQENLTTVHSRQAMFQQNA